MSDVSLARNRESLAYFQVTGATLDGGSDLATLIGQAIPAGTETVVIEPETQNIRYRDDGTVPTLTVGMLLFVGSWYTFNVAQVGSMRLRSAVAGAILNVTFYGARPAQRVSSGTGI